MSRSSLEQPALRPRLLSALSLGALLAALFMYLFFRSRQTVVIILANWLSPAGWYEATRALVQTALPIPNSVTGFLPGSLWVFTATAVLRNIRYSFAGHSLPLWPLPLLVNLFFEAQQVLGFTIGVFDNLDIIGGFIACALAMLWPRGAFSRMAIEWHELTPLSRSGCASLFLMLGLAYVWR